MQNRPAGHSASPPTLAAGQLFFYAPGTSFVGVESAGLEACMLTVPTASLELAAEGFVDTVMLRSVTALNPSPEVEQLRSLLRSTIKRPTDRPGEHVVEAAAGVLATDSTPRRSRVGRRLGSHTIVVRSIEDAERTQTHQPTVGDLCRASGASASRLRQAFVDVFDMPPTKYFQHRLLSRLRDELALAGPTTQSVTGILSSLGATEFGRIFGRYENAFGELPSATLRRLPSND